jgi:hypothetical protein
MGGKKPAARPKPSTLEPPPEPPPSPSPAPTLISLDPAEMLAMLQASAANFDWPQVELASLQRYFFIF